MIIMFLIACLNPTSTQLDQRVDLEQGDWVRIRTAPGWPEGTICHAWIAGAGTGKYGGTVCLLPQ